MALSFHYPFIGQLVRPRMVLVLAAPLSLLESRGTCGGRCFGGLLRLSPWPLEVNWPVPMRINTTTAAAIIVTITQGVRDFLAVGVRSLHLLDQMAPSAGHVDAGS